MNVDFPVATYARTSSEKQQSCTTQLQICRELVTQRHWRLAFQLRDEGMRGAKADRPAYVRLLELAEQGRIKAVVCWKLDRLFRSLKEAGTAQELFARHGVSIVSATEPFDSSTALGKLVFGFLTNWGQFETELIRERALLGFERRVREGTWTGAHVPFGYRRATTGKLEVEPAEAETVRLMHSRYGVVKGDSQLANWLNSTGTTLRGKPWTGERVRRVLTNPIAVGRLEVRGLSQQHDALAIIPKERFAKTTAIRGSLRYLGTHRPADERRVAIDRVFDAYLEDLRARGDAVEQEA